MNTEPVRRSVILSLALILSISSPAWTAPLRIAVMPALGNLPFWVAQSKDFKVIKSDSLTDIVSRLRDGEVDGAALPIPLGINLKLDGVDLKAVLLTHRGGSSLLVREGIDAVRELKGKAVGVPHRFSLQNVLLYRLCEKEGLRWGRDVKVVPSDLLNLIVDMMFNEVDAFFADEPFPSFGKLRNLGSILKRSADVWGAHPGDALFIRGDSLRKNRQAVERGVTALVQASRKILKDRAGAVKLYINATGQKSPAIEELLVRHPERILYDDLLPRKSEFEEIEGYLLKMALITRRVAIKELLNDEYAKLAYRK